MKIVCLGWGSLTWDPRSLKINSKWNSDGPQLPIEFARISNDGRITLVICESAKLVTVLWAIMNTNSIEDAIESLRKREGTSQKYIHCNGKNKTSKLSTIVESNVKNWINKKGYDYVLWTGLPPKINNTERVPEIGELIQHLNSLKINSFNKAKEYIQNAPKQISTNYRKKLEDTFRYKN